MGRLVFVGLGLWDADDMTLRARRVLQEADEVVAEFYTSHLFGTSLEALAEALGRPIEVLPREGVESGRDAVLARAAGDKTVAFVTAGDALTATTHQDLRLAAMEAGLEVEIVHGVSIKTAASGLLGLSDYKFGRTTTVVFPEERFFPESPLDVVLENRARGLHTLVLLDIRADEGRYMTAAEGAAVLVEIARRRAERDEPVDPVLFERRTPVCVVARAGSPEPLVTAGPAEELADADLGPPLHCLVVPGRLTDEEAAVVSRTTRFRFTAGQTRLLRGWSPPVHQTSKRPLVNGPRLLYDPCQRSPLLGRRPVPRCRGPAGPAADKTAVPLPDRPLFKALGRVGLYGDDRRY